MNFRSGVKSTVVLWGLLLHYAVVRLVTIFPISYLYQVMKMNNCCSSAVDDNKGPRTRSIAHPPTGMWRRMERQRQKFMGQDKGSLTEQQKKRMVTTILRRRIYKTNSEMYRATLTAQCPAHSQAASHFPPASSSPGTQHDVTWYRIPYSVWPGWVSQSGCVPSRLLVKINPVLAEHRTLSTPYSVPSTSCPGTHFPVDHHHFSAL